MEPISGEGKRLVTRLVVYPADVPSIEQALSEFSNDPSEKEDGSHVVLAQILSSASEYEVCPRILREDSSELTPEQAEVAPLLLNISAQVSVGSRDLVDEDGPDVMNSSDEDSPKEERGDKLTGTYTDGLKAPVLLTQSQVAQQRALYAHLKAASQSAWSVSGPNCPSSTETDTDSSQNSIESSRAPSRPSPIVTLRSSFLSDSTDDQSPPADSRSASRFDGPPRQPPPRPSTPVSDTRQSATRKSDTRQSSTGKFLSDSSGVSEVNPRRSFFDASTLRDLARENIWLFPAAHT
jgi:hypothetical protein